jgi:hypothetical protein
MPDKISMTREQFNELNDLLRKTSDFARSAFTTTDPAFRLMPTKNGRAIICKITDDLIKAGHTFIKIAELLENVKDNYMSETKNKNANERRK